MLVYHGMNVYGIFFSLMLVKKETLMVYYPS